MENAAKDVWSYSKQEIDTMMRRLTIEDAKILNRILKEKVEFMKTLVVIIALFPLAAMAQATQCQTFSDGVTVCYPVGGGSTYGK